MNNPTYLPTYLPGALYPQFWAIEREASAQLRLFH
jgi:hypothetical protein